MTGYYDNGAPKPPSAAPVEPKKLALNGSVRVALISAVGLLLTTTVTTIAGIWMAHRTAVTTAQTLQSTGAVTDEKLNVIHLNVNSRLGEVLRQNAILLDELASAKEIYARLNPQDRVALAAAKVARSRALRAARMIDELEELPLARPGLFPPNPRRPAGLR